MLRRIAPDWNKVVFFFGSNLDIDCFLLAFFILTFGGVLIYEQGFLYLKLNLFYFLFPHK